MFKTFSRGYTIFTSSVTNNLYPSFKNHCFMGTSLKNYSSINSIENRIKIQLENSKALGNLETVLKRVNSKENFMRLDKNLYHTNKNISSSELCCLKDIILSNKENIKFNEYNYYKHLFCQTDFLTAYVIIWNIGAETNIHMHPSNGCFILNLLGKWEETIYNPDVIKINKLSSDSVCFIDNSIGSHKVKYLETKFPGISINIYSPTSEI